MTDSDVVIRPYEARDRAQVRHICHVTGYMGEPVAWMWRDTESFADLFTSYYTDAEPQSALVAELDGVVAGYLLGCIDSSPGVESRNDLRAPFRATWHRVPARHGRGGVAILR